MHKFLRATLIATAALTIGAPAASAQTRKYEGTVVSVDRSARTFRIHDSERGTIRVRVTSKTRFERVTFAGLRRGMRNIETTVRRSNGRWVALGVERSGGGGNHNGSDDSTSRDDRRGRGSDDAPGDDRGGHGRDD
jgi:hypothetical protein